MLKHKNCIEIRQEIGKKYYNYQLSVLKKFVEVKADPRWAPITALKYKEQGLLISAREVGLPISLRLTDTVKH